MFCKQPEIRRGIVIFGVVVKNQWLRQSLLGPRLSEQQVLTVNMTRNLSRFVKEFNPLGLPPCSPQTLPNRAFAWRPR